MFEPPDPALLERIRLPVPSAGTKGVLVFPTVDGKLVAGPTAHRPARQARLERAARGARRGAGQGEQRWCRRCAGAEPIASYAGLRPAGRGVQLPDRALARAAAPGARRRDPLHRPVRMPRHRRARHGAAARGGRRAGRGAAAAPGRAAARSSSRGGALRRLLVEAPRERTAAARARRRHDRREGGARRRAAAAARVGDATHPDAASATGLGRADRGGRAERIRGVRGRGAVRSVRRGGCVRARPSGRVGDRLGRGDRRAAVAERRVAGQAARWTCSSGCTAAGLEDEIKARSGLPLDPYFSAGKLDVDAGATWPTCRPRASAARCGSARWTRSCATGSARASRRIPPPRRACSCSRSGATDWDPWLCETFGVPAEALPRIEDTVGELGHAAPPELGP